MRRHNHEDTHNPYPPVQLGIGIESLISGSLTGNRLAMRASQLQAPTTLRHN